MVYRTIKQILISALACATITACAYTQDKTQKPTPREPHYLADVPHHADKLDQLIDKWKVYNSELYRYPESPPGQGREESISNFLDGSERSYVTVDGERCEIIYNGYHKTEKGYRVYLGDGIKEITNEEFSLVKTDIETNLVDAVNKVYGLHSNVQNRIIQSWDRILHAEGLLDAKDSLANHLEDKVTEELTVKDTMYVPSMAKKDFLPKKFVFGNIPALGLCYLDSGLVFYDPKARIWDHIEGNPSILIHELCHRNSKLQGMPYAFAFNAETWASLPILSKNDPMTFLLHSYLADVRQISKTLYSFDSERAFRESFFRSAGGIEIRRDKLKAYYEQIQKIALEAQNFALDKFIPEYYAHHSFWSSLNNQLHDKNAALKVAMYAAYEPTLIQDANTTRRWAEKNSLIIKETLEAAIKAMEDRKDEDPSILMGKKEQDALMVLLARAGIDVTRLTADDLRRILINLSR